MRWIIAAAAFLINSSMAVNDYCMENTYASSETREIPMRFTKETNNEEFAVAGKFKGLHCCAEGYRSIEW